MLDAAQGGALDRQAAWVVWVDFDDPAEQVGLVGVDRHVKARVGGVPAVAEAARGHAVAVVKLACFGAGCGQCGARAEVAIPVFFTGQEGAPGGDAVAAVVDRAVSGEAVELLAGGDRTVVTDDVLVRFHQGVASGRARHAALGVGRDAAAEDRTLDHRPLAVDAAGFHDRNAVRGLRLAGLADVVAVDLTIGEQDFLVRVLIVHAQHAAVADGCTAGAREGEEVHAVAVHAELLRLLGGGFRRVTSEGRATWHDGVAPGRKDLGGVASRNGDLVDHGGRGATQGCVQGAGVRWHAFEADAREAQAGGHGSGLHGADQTAEGQATHRGQGRGADTALDELAAAGFDAVDDVADGGNARFGERHVIGGVEGTLHRNLRWVDAHDRPRGGGESVPADLRKRV